MFHESNRKRHYDMSGAPTLKLGLIGDNIAASRAPDLHRIAGRLNNMDVQYDRLIPKELNQTFDQIFENCRDNGYQALNITYPYKEHVVSQVAINDPMVRAIAAVNTVVFDGTLSKAYNTDYTGFIAAYEQVRASAAPGVCCLVGTGGVSSERPSSRLDRSSSPSSASASPVTDTNKRRIAPPIR